MIGADRKTNCIGNSEKYQQPTEGGGGVGIIRATVCILLSGRAGSRAGRRPQHVGNEIGQYDNNIPARSCRWRRHARGRYDEVRHELDGRAHTK